MCVSLFPVPCSAQEQSLRTTTEAAEVYAQKGLLRRAEDTFRKALSLRTEVTHSAYTPRLRIGLARVLERSSEGRSRRLLEALHYAHPTTPSCSLASSSQSLLLARIYTRLELSSHAQFWRACAQRQGAYPALPVYDVHSDGEPSFFLEKNPYTESD